MKRIILQQRMHKILWYFARIVERIVHKIRKKWKLNVSCVRNLLNSAFGDDPNSIDRLHLKIVNKSSHLFSARDINSLESFVEFQREWMRMEKVAQRSLRTSKLLGKWRRNSTIVAGETLFLFQHAIQYALDYGSNCLFQFNSCSSDWTFLRIFSTFSADCWHT